MNLGKHKTAIFLIIIGGTLFGIIAGAFFALTHDLPPIRALEAYRPSAITRIYSADRVLLAELYAQKRDPVALKMVPEYLTAALLATEDRNFYKHSGVDLKGVARAIIKDIWAGEFVEGASTITQQLAKTLFLTTQKTLTRKIKEALLAFHLERRYTKDEILTLYLNQVYFGSGAYGAASAARIYFGKPIQELNLAECALIAAMPKAPSRYSPLVNPELARKRRDTVLKQMLETGIISPEAFTTAVNSPVVLKPAGRDSTQAPYFVDYVKNLLEQILGSSILYKGGLEVRTTLSHSMQQAAEQALAGGLAALEKRMLEKRTAGPGPQGALVALGVETGEILAMVGGKDYDQSPYNRASAARRQPGSAFKPIVYAHALEQGFSQNKLILDAPVVFKGGQDGRDWRPENFSQTYLGEITLRKALAVSENIPAIRLIESLGPSSVARFAHSLGIESSLEPNLSLALGTSEVSLIELTAAYTVFANRGEHNEAFAVKSVIDSNGRVLWQHQPQSRIVMSRTGAAVITDMLQGVVKEGTGRKARFLGGPIAGKTGTTNEFRDALFIGYSPALAAGVWVGQDDSAPLGKGETGARAALPVWMAFMEKALAESPHRYFDIPDDVVRMSVNTVTGRIAPTGSPASADMLFKKGTEPRR